MIRNTASKERPWYEVPADTKWLSRVVVAAAVIDTLAGLDLAYPRVDQAKLTEIANARETLISSKHRSRMGKRARGDSHVR